jgi:lipoate-protein ligase A
LPSPDARADALPVFGFVARHEQPLADGMAQELAWMQRAAHTGRAAAHLWRGVQGLVVPRAYERAPHWRAACADSAAEGWPVQVRASGGGLVPQGPGVLNLSLAWAVPEGQAMTIDPVYRALCDELAAAFARLGVRAEVQAVEGSFCDGRFNLAVDGAKLVGTAQCWRRIEGVQVVLAHALMLVEADPVALTARCNAFEAVLGHDRRYRADRITSLARACGGATANLAARAEQVIAERFARMLEPKLKETTTWS